MQMFAILLLSVIFVALITNSVPTIATDDSDDNNTDSKDADKLNVVPTKDQKYEIYLHVTVRNVHGDLVSITNKESCSNVSKLLASGWGCRVEYLDHEITDYAFDKLLGEKEIITVDNIKYEKVQISTSSDNTWLFDVYDHELIQTWDVEICGEPSKKYGYDCAEIFWTSTSVVYLEIDDVTTANWTILREMN